MDSKNVWRGLAFGAFASCVAEAATIPVDVVKTRLQMQSQGLVLEGGQVMYRSSFHAFQHIARSEGGRALFKGISPALLRQATYGGMRYGFYTPFKRVLGVPDDMPRHQIPLVKKILAGCGAGAISAAVANPTDLIKVRMQADGMGKSVSRNYRGLYDAFSSIVRSEGVVGLWNGVLPTCGRAAVLAAVELSTYDELKTRLHLRGMQEGLGLHISSALGAGFLAALASSPFDVVKSRMMGQPVGTDGIGLYYRSMTHCFAKSLSSDGVSSLWKGFWPNYARVGPRVLIVFVVMEQLRKVFA